MNHDNSDDRLADVLEEYVDGENTEYDPEAPYGRTGIGKSARYAEMMAAVSDHDDTGPEWFDPKGDLHSNDEGGDPR